MPNHVTHRMTVTGPVDEVARFKSTCIVERSGKNYAGEDEQWTEFDFNTLIPMPEILRGSEEGSHASFGYEAITGRPYPGSFGSMLHFPWVVDLGITNHAQLLAYAKKSRPEWIKAGEQAIAAQKATGHTSWYPWAIENWGTKWGAYSFEMLGDLPGPLEFKFETAWASPTPIFDALAAKFPQLKFAVVGFDEGWNFAVHGEIADGLNNVLTVEATAKLYEQAYGEPPEENED